jgi:hypothetical protein
MYRDVEDYVTNCKICQKNKFTVPYFRDQFQETVTQFRPWNKLYLDIVGPTPMTEEDHKYMLTCQDNLSKYLVAIPMFSQTAEVVLNFMRYVILQYGIPSSIVIDQDTQFTGDIFKRLCKLLKIHKLNTSAYHPESNGSLERAHKTMIEYLRCFCDPKNNNWDMFLQFAMTQYTPYEVLFGRKSNIPGHLQQTPVPVYNYDYLVYDLKRKVQECHEIARANLRQTKQHRRA